MVAPAPLADLSAQISPYLPLVRETLGKMGLYRNHADRDQFYSLGVEGVWKALRTYDPAKGTTLRTWIISNIRWNIGANTPAYRRVIQPPPREPLHDRLPAPPGPNPQLDDVPALEAVITNLSPREQAIIRARFQDDKTHREIAAQHGISEERIRQLLAVSYDKLRRSARIAALAAVLMGCSTTSSVVATELLSESPEFWGCITLILTLLFL